MDIEQRVCKINKRIDDGERRSDKEKRMLERFHNVIQPMYMFQMIGDAIKNSVFDYNYNRFVEYETANKWPDL